MNHGRPMVNQAFRPILRGPALGLVLAAGLAASCSHKPPYEGRSVAQLEEMLRSKEANTQIQGACGLGLWGAEAGPAVPTLIDLLNSRNPLVRENAAMALGKIGPEARAAVPGLIQMLQDPKWVLRRQAALALGGIGPAARQAEGDLKKLSHRSREEPAVRKAAEDALAKIAPARPPLTGGDSRPR
jgi:HEAT repeat protein